MRLFNGSQTSDVKPRRRRGRLGRAARALGRRTSRPGPFDVIVEATSATTIPADVVVVGAFEGGVLTPSARAIDEVSGGKLTALIAGGDLAEEVGASVMLHDLSGIAADRVLLVALGAQAGFDATAFRQFVEGSARALQHGRAASAAVGLAEVDVPGHALDWRLQTASRLFADAAYRFDVPSVSRNSQRPARRGVQDVTLLVSAEPTPALREAVRRGAAVAEGMALAKDLGNLPPNVCSPPYLAEAAMRLGREFGMAVDVLERDDMAKLGMGAALAVGGASKQACKFIVMHYKGARDAGKPIVLVGKGVTFDTGGVSLKPGDDMDMMKYDMAGAASVFGVMKTIARLELPLHVIGIVGAVENMPGGDATRPGDVVTSMSGQTIEILNTDAEGRLVLCDSLTYAEHFEPEYVIDVATLTGACVIALGAQTTGLFSNDDRLADELFACGMVTGDRAWRLPVWDEYQLQLKSNFADMSNIGGRPAGAVTAACFLSRFAKKYAWAHLDIAGTASVGGDAKGATGRPVPLLSEFLMRRVHATTA